MPPRRTGRIDKHGSGYRLQIKVGGERIRQTFPTRAEAERALGGILAEIDRDQSIELARKLGSLTVADVIAFYRDRRWKDLELSTLARYDNVTEKYILPGIGHLQAKEVCATPVVLEGWLSTVPWGSARKALEVLGPAFRMARDNGLLPTNPVDKIRRPKRPDKRRKKEIPTPAEVEKIVIAAYEDDVWWGYFVELTSTLGLRRAETCALRWEDFEFPGNAKHGIVHIRRAVGTKDGGIYLKPPKSGLERELLVHRSLFEGMWDFDGRSGWLFPGRDVRLRKPGEPLSSSSTAGRLLVWLLHQGGEASCPRGRIGADARRAIGTNSATFSQVSQQLESRGYLVRETNPRRTFRLSLTPTGLEEAQRLSLQDDVELPVHPTTMGHRFQAMASRLGIAATSGASFTLHSLRHFRATHLYNASKDWVQVAKYLGHTSPAITMELYANNVVQPTQALLADAAIRFDDSD